MLASSPSGAAQTSASEPLQDSERQALARRVRVDDRSGADNITIADLSEAETLGVSSPDLPPISAPVRASTIPRTPRSAQVSTNNDFYTASWGSPYDLSHVPAGAHSSIEGAALAFDDIDEDSPSLAFGLSHLIPTRLSISKIEVTPTRPSTPTGWSPSQDTPRVPGVEVIDPESTKIPAKDLFNSLTKAGPRRASALGHTVEFADFPNVHQRPKQAQAVKSHRSHTQNRTVRQEDIVGQAANLAMESSKYAAASPSAKSDSASTPSKTSMNNFHSVLKPDSAVDQASAPPFLLEHATTGSNISYMAVPRIKKKLAYKGKTCWINLPLDSRIGDNGELPTPLSAAEIGRKLAVFRENGYNTDGFDHQDDTETIKGSTAKSQTCAVYPVSVGRDSEETRSRPIVQLPDIRQWQQYVNELKEAKLRALGVSLGDEPAAEQPSSLSRVSSSQFSGLPFSPPLPPSSAGSHRMSIGGNMFPLGFVPGSSNHTSTRSIASPLSSLSNPRQSLHMHRQSMFISPPLPHQQAMSPQGLPSWSPQPFGFSAPSGSIASPGLSNGPSDMRSPISPFSGLVESIGGFQFPPRAELVAQLQSQKQQQMLRQSQILPVRPASTLAEVPESEGEEEGAVSQSRSVPPEMFNPRPGHRHNISQKLEANVSKGFDLDKPLPTVPQAVNRQAPQPSEDDAAQATKTVPEWRREAPVVSDHHKPIAAKETMTEHSDPKVDSFIDHEDDRAQPTEQKRNIDLVDATEEIQYEAKFDESVTSNPWENDPTFQREASTSEKRPSLSSIHSSKLSLTGLNVAAKEFKFNPKANPAAVFNPAIFSTSAFQFNAEDVQPFVPQSTSGIASPPLSKSLNTPSKTKLNIDAPAFSPSGFGGSELSKSEFHFAGPPILKPTAPVFEPGAPSVVSDGVFSASAGSESSRLFGSVNLDDFALHDKKSKAVPILPPSPADRKEAELLEDEDGRLGQGFAKRTRRGGDDGDDVPRFASMDDVMADRPESSVTPTVQASAAEEVSHSQEGIIADVQSEEDGLDGLEQEEDSLFDILTGRNTTVSATIPESTLDFGPRDISPFNAPEEPAITHTASLSPSPPVPSSPTADSTAPAAIQIDDSTQLSPMYATEEDEKADDMSEPLISPPSSAVVSKPGADTDFMTSQRNLNLSSPSRKLPASVRYYDEVDQPTFQEIDAIMQQFNDAGSDFGVERDLPSWPETSPGSLSTARQHFFPDLAGQVAGGSNTVRGDRLGVAPQDLDSASLTQDPFSDARAVNGYDSPAVRPREEESARVSDWNDFSSGVEERIRARGPFLDSHVSELINSTLGKRLGPLEKQLQAISSNMLTLSTSRSGRRAQSRATLDSDADDEDDEVATGIISRAWSRSPVRDRKSERIRAIIQEALSAHRPEADPLSGAVASSVILDALQDMKVVMTAEITKSLQHDSVINVVEAALSERGLPMTQSHAPQLDDIRAAIEAALATQLSSIHSPRGANDDESGALSELLQKNIEVTAKAAEESAARQIAEQRHTESARKLELAEEELILLRASIKDHELLHATHREKSQSMERRLAEVDDDSAEMSSKLRDLTDTNVALKATLEEYRLSHDKWRTDIDNVNKEKERLAGISGILKLQAEEAVRIRQSMGDRLEKLSSDAANATSRLADERSKWQTADADYRSRLDYWKDKAEAERVTRENFERKIEGIEALDRENMKLRHLAEHLKQERDRLQNDVENFIANERQHHKQMVNLEHLQTEHGKLTTLVEKLSNESQQHKEAASKHARDWRDARDHGQQELQRTRLMMQAEIDAAASRSAIVRTGFEDEIGRLRSELESTKLANENVQARANSDLAAEVDARRQAIREHTEGKSAALLEQKQAFEERFEDLRRQHRRDLDHVIENKNQSETFLREAHAQRIADLEEQHQRAVQQAYDDKERIELYLSERLTVADGKVELLEDKISHLTSKVSTAQSAAQAAAQLAQTARGPQTSSLPAILPSAAGNVSGASSAALRESLQVLQEQLEERQLHIESLESKLEKVDESLPEKLKARDVEVTWLRELLGVRLDDLSELCDLLARDDFDRESVQNAAIRLRTGLKMNIQERERQAEGNTPLSAGAANIAASIQSFATPKAAQLARVIGEWRSTSARGSTRPPSSLFSGLMTPPASNLRRTPEQPNTVELRRGSAASSISQFDRGQPSSSSSSRVREKSRADFPSPSLKEPMQQNQQPHTPLLHANAYDDDAETRYSTDGFYDDEDSTVEGTPRRSRHRLDA